MTSSKSNATISVTLDKDVKIFLEKYAQEIDLTLSKFVRNLIYVSLESYSLKIFVNTGAIKMVVPFRTLLESIPAYKDMVDRKITSDAESSVTVTVGIDSFIKKELEKIAKDAGLPAKILARNLVYIALDDFKLLRKVGLIRLAVSFRDFLDKFQNYDPKADDRFLAQT